MSNSENKEKKKSLVSVVIPVYNEENGINPITERIISVFKGLVNHDYELILVDDCSTDQSLIKIISLSNSNPKIKYLSFTRNFGHQAAVKAGLDFATGACAISMDADLQHPPELIPPMLKKWQEGFEIVYTKRLDDKRQRRIKRFSSKLYYSLINSLSDIKIEEGAADFRLIDRKVLEIIKNLKENNLFLRGMVKWLGYSQIGITYQPDLRTTDQTKYSLSKMFSLAIVGITSFSIRPLRIALWVGLVSSLLGFIYGIYAVYGYIFTDLNLTGWSSLIVAVVFLGGVQLITLGIIGEYLGKLFIQVKGRPNYIIKKSNIEKES